MKENDRQFSLEKDCNPGKVGNRDYTLSKGIKGVRMKIHKTPYLFGVLDKPSQSTIRQYARSGKINQNEITNN